MFLILFGPLQHLQDDMEDLKSHRNHHYSAGEKASLLGGVSKTTNCVKNGKCFCAPHQAPNPELSQTRAMSFPTPIPAPLSSV